MYLSGTDITIEGNFDISVTDTKTVTSTRLHDQRESRLCWDYAASSSIRKSLRIKLGTTLFIFILN